MIRKYWRWLFSCLDHTFPAHLFYQLYKQETSILNITGLVQKTGNFLALLLKKSVVLTKKSFVLKNLFSYRKGFNQKTVFYKIWHKKVLPLVRHFLCLILKKHFLIATFLHLNTIFDYWVKFINYLKSSAHHFSLSAIIIFKHTFHVSTFAIRTPIWFLSIIRFLLKFSFHFKSNNQEWRWIWIHLSRLCFLLMARHDGRISESEIWEENISFKIWMFVISWNEVVGCTNKH